MSYQAVSADDMGIRQHHDTEYHGPSEEIPQIKPFDNINIAEVSSSGTNSIRSGSLRLSGQTLSKQATDEKDALSREDSLRSKTSAFSKSGSWTFEIISVLVAAAAVTAIVGVLAHFDGRSVPAWPLDITLSALIALLATLANANLTVPLQSGLSQMKWVKFKSGRAPLTDMEAFDDASRGTWGAITLLAKARGGWLGSFGAVLTILALALGPFSQQIASYRSHTTESETGALIPRALIYEGYLPGRSSANGFVPILPMKSAVYSGLFAENNNPSAALNVTCSTGNCTYEPFETLAVCNSCIDMTQYMTRYCPDDDSTDRNSSNCGWELPGGSARLNTSNDAFSMTSSFPAAYGDMPYATIMRLTFMGTESRDAPDVLAPWAEQCTLSACIQTMKSAVYNGYLSENVTDTLMNSTVVDISDIDGEIPIDLVSPTTNNTFTLAMGSKLAMQSWFSGLFRNGSASRDGNYINQTEYAPNNVIVNLTVGVSSGETFFDTDIVTAYYWNYYEYAGGIEMLMSDLAVSMTVSMRSFVGAVPHPGLALSDETFVHVKWGFIAVPVLVVILTAAFLGAAIWRSQRSHTKLWKSSALAMLFHGLDVETRERVGSGGTLAEKRRRARDFKVQLDAQGDSGSLLRV